MTDKEAINNLKSYIEELIEDYGYHKDIVEFRDSIEYLENAIKKKNDRITELEKIEEAHREANGELRKELQLKDRMIDLMANCIATNDSDLCQFLDITTEKRIKEYFTKKASEDNDIY